MMSWTPKIYGYGPYKKDLASDLDYPESWYEEVEEGTVIHSCIWGANTRSQGEEAMGALNLSLEGMKLRIKEVKDPRDYYGPDYVQCYDHTTTAKALTACKKFLKHGWILFFDPEC